MIVSGDVPFVPVSSVNTLEKSLGGVGFTDNEQIRLARSTVFPGARYGWSIIGVPGGPAGTAWEEVAPMQRPQQPQSPWTGNITGYLQYQHRLGLYDFVPSDDVTFDLDAPGTTGTTNVTSVNGHNYPGTLPAGTTNGFHVVTLDSRSLTQVDNAVYSTDSAAALSNFASRIAETYSSYNNNPQPLVFITSIGRPTIRPPADTQTADGIQRLGGNRLAWLNFG